MTLTEVMKQLEAWGSAQNRKVYERHGAATQNLFGVSFANLYALQKKLETNHNPYGWDQTLCDDVSTAASQPHR